MYSLRASIWNETLKLALKKKTLFFLILTAAVPLGAGVLLANFQQGIGIGAIRAEDFPILMLGLFTALFLPIFIFMGAAEQFSGEVGDRTMKNVLTRPVSRFKIFASKQASLAIYIALYLAAALLSSIAGALFFAGSGVQAILDGLLAYSTALWPLLALSFGAVFLAQFFSSSSGALTVSLLLYAALKVMAFFFPQLAVYSPTAYTDWHMLWIGSSLATNQIGTVFMFLTACSILFFTAGYYIFDKKEI